jgi:signal transduction histidine kinase
MSKAFLSCVALCLLIPVGVRAGVAAPSPAPMRDDSIQPSFDELIADAKKTMMSNPQVALKSARKAEMFAESHANFLRQHDAIATSLWLEAEALTRTNQVDSARPVADRAINLAERGGKITKLNGDLSLTLARIGNAKGDIALALKSYQRAYDIFARLNVPRSQAIALQGLGSIYDEAHNFNHAISYFQRASEIYPQDAALSLTAKNYLGFALLHLGRYEEATKSFQDALTIAASLHSPFLKANILANIASVYAKRHRFADAERAADLALRLLGKNDENGGAPFVWGVKGEIEYERGDMAAAASDLDKAFRGKDLTTTVASFRDFHETAYKVYRQLGNPALALAHSEAFRRLDDAGRALAESANLALIGARFDFTAQQLEIETLKSQQLKRESILKEARAATQRAVLVAGLLSSGLLILWISWRHMTVRMHRSEISRANVALTQTLAERDVEIARRTEVESELRQSKETAEQANLAKSHFLANMSHELRTPFNAIMGFSEIIAKDKLGVAGHGKYVEYATDIYASGSNLLAILNDILDMAHIDAGKMVLAEDEVVLGDVVRRVVEEFDEAGHNAGKVIKVAGADRDIRVRGDARRLHQIVVNLVSNAVKFTRDNGAIVVRIEPAEDGVDLIVSDDGIGIPSDKLGLVLQPFGQAESAYARAHGGVGLGLPIVKSLVELHGGSFTISSVANAGTTARVHLPMERVLGCAQTTSAAALAS